MQLTNLDTLVRRSLLERGLPLHFYLEYLVHASACLRELTFDALKVIRTVRLPLNDYYACDLPDDFVDDVAVAIAVGGLLSPVAKKDSLNPLRLHDATTGAFTTYTEEGDEENSDPGGVYTWFWNANDYGEPTGRYFGTGGGAKANGYKVVAERRQIQFAEGFTADEIILQYISDGQSADNAAQVNVLATAAIQSYINWKASPNAAVELSPEGRTWINQRRVLVARLNPLTTTDIKQLLRENYRGTIKT